MSARHGDWWKETLPAGIQVEGRGNTRILWHLSGNYIFHLQQISAKVWHSSFLVRCAKCIK
jgi:hypothetical protein